MADEKEKIDPFDVAALEKSLNDSATRVSTIWVSFLIFSLYLLTAATTVTHRQLFLAEPVKLPVLNIDLPLWGFFFLAPILFVIFHAYVLIQVILLARTAAAYNEAVDENIRIGSDNARVRQRLANTLFAQIFAGSPREREGLFGWLLLVTAWVTLTVAPIFVLIVFELKFLPFQSGPLTWFHRILITADLLVVIGTWPIFLDPRMNPDLLGMLKRRYFFAAATGVLIFSYFVLSFPGELHATWTRRLWPDYNAADETIRASECATPWWLRALLPGEFDRLFLPYERVGNPNQSSLSGPRQNLRSRNFTCAIFNHASLRDLDFTESNLSGASFRGAEIQNTGFDAAQIQTTSFYQSKLESTSFRYSKGNGATFTIARLWSADFTYAELVDSDFTGAQLQGASLVGANLLGADLTEARLIAVSLQGSSLVGAKLSKAQLIGASIAGAQLQAADLGGADLEAADLSDSSMQGSLFGETNLRLADLTKAKIWNAVVNQCNEAHVHEPNLSYWLAPSSFEFLYDSYGYLRRSSDVIRYRSSQGTLDRYIEEVTTKIASERRDAFARNLRERLADTKFDQVQVERARIWLECGQRVRSRSEFDNAVRDRLVKLACETDLRNQIIGGIYRGWIASDPEAQLARRGKVDQSRQERGRLLARALLALDQGSCAQPVHLSDQLKAKLRESAGE